MSLPHIIGLVVSIGITADSFIVYFERIRDEMKEGRRSLRAAVEVAWVRARRTILIADAVMFIAAVVLYALAVGGVAGFAAVAAELLAATFGNSATAEPSQNP